MSYGHADQILAKAGKPEPPEKGGGGGVGGPAQQRRPGAGPDGTAGGQYLTTQNGMGR